MFALQGFTFVSILGCVVFLVAAQSGTKSCVDKHKQPMDSCLQSYTDIITAALSGSANAEGDSANAESGPAASPIFGAMCSIEGKAAMMCIAEAIAACPDLAKDTSNPILAGIMKSVNVSDVMKAGGMDIFCSMMGVGSNTDGGACAKIQDCFTPQPQPEPDMNKDMDMAMAGVDYKTIGKVRPFIFFQQLTGMMCGQMRSMITCFMDVAKQCSTIDVETLNSQISEMVKKQNPDLKDMHTLTYEEQRNFIEHDCDHVPKDFHKDTCVVKELMSPMFMECYTNFTTEYPDKAARGSCKSYNALKGCFDDNVGKCGERQAAFMSKYSPLMVTGLDDSCETSGTTVTRASAVVMTIVGLILGLML